MFCLCLASVTGMKVSLTTGTTDRTERTAGRFTDLNDASVRCGMMQTVTWRTGSSVRSGPDERQWTSQEPLRAPEPTRKTEDGGCVSEISSSVVRRVTSYEGVKAVWGFCLTIKLLLQWHFFSLVDLPTEVTGKVSVTCKGSYTQSVCRRKYRPQEKRVLTDSLISWSNSPLPSNPPVNVKVMTGSQN